MKTDAAVLSSGRTRWRTADLVMLAKPRLNVLVILTTLAGYYVAAGSGFDGVVLAHALIGTALVAAGASAFNQVLERDTDGLMRRTQGRPLPDGRVQPQDARLFAIVLSAAGVIQLAVGTNLLAAAVAIATLVTYVAIYTPLKRRTPLATIVGAVPGALPPVIGWTAARGTLDLGALVLFGIVFFWQMPHFLAIAWMYRDEYARAGIPLLPVVEPDGRSTGRQVMLHAAVLLPVTLIPAVIGLAGSRYLVGALLLGVAFFALAVRFARTRDRESARTLFLASITYLPLLWILMAADRLQ